MTTGYPGTAELLSVSLFYTQGNWGQGPDKKWERIVDRTLEKSLGQDVSISWACQMIS